MERAKEFLDQFIFYGLKNLNTGFDAPGIKYFSKEDFEIVLDRVEFFKLSIYGIEAWPNKQYGDTEVYQSYRKKPANPKWYRSAYKKLLKRGITSHFSASYGIQGELLDLFIGKPLL